MLFLEVVQSNSFPLISSTFFWLHLKQSTLQPEESTEFHMGSGKPYIVQGLNAIFFHELTFHLV